jgi:hypothetical protein
MTPKPETLFPWGTQPRRLYEALATCGEISNAQITRDLHILAYSGVIATVRKALRPHSLDIAKRRYPGGVWTYRLATKERNISCQT